MSGRSVASVGRVGRSVGRVESVSLVGWSVGRSGQSIESVDRSGLSGRSVGSVGRSGRSVGYVGSVVSVGGWVGSVGRSSPSSVGRVVPGGRYPSGYLVANIVANIVANLVANLVAIRFPYTFCKISRECMCSEERTYNVYFSLPNTCIRGKSYKTCREIE